MIGLPAFLGIAAVFSSSSSPLSLSSLSPLALKAEIVSVKVVLYAISIIFSVNALTLH